MLTRATLHARQRELLARLSAILACPACRDVPQACTRPEHSQRALRGLMAEVAALLEALSG